MGLGAEPPGNKKSKDSISVWIVLSRLVPICPPKMIATQAPNGAHMGPSEARAHGPHGSGPIWVPISGPVGPDPGPHSQHVGPRGPRPWSPLNRNIRMSPGARVLEQEHSMTKWGIRTYLCMEGLHVRLHAQVNSGGI